MLPVPVLLSLREGIHVFLADKGRGVAAARAVVRTETPLNQLL